MFRPQPLHQLPIACASVPIAAARMLLHRHIADTLLLAGIWHTLGNLGNRLAIAWQYYGNRSVFLAIAFLSHCRHTKMYAFLIGRRIPPPAQVPLLYY